VTNERGTLAYARLKPSFNKSPTKKQKKKEKNFLVLWPNTCWMGIVWRLDEDVLVVEILPPWKMYFDGAAHQDGAGVLFLTSEGEVLPHSFTLSKPCSNNLAEYQALILDLRWLWIWKSCNSYGDFKLVINQLLGNYSVKKPDLNWFHTIITQTKRLIGWLGDVTIEHVPRKKIDKQMPLQDAQDL